MAYQGGDMVGVVRPGQEEHFITDITWNYQCMVMIKSRLTFPWFHHCFKILHRQCTSLFLAPKADHSNIPWYWPALWNFLCYEQICTFAVFIKSLISLSIKWHPQVGDNWGWSLTLSFHSEGNTCREMTWLAQVSGRAGSWHQVSWGSVSRTVSRTEGGTGSSGYYSYL